MSEKDLEMFNKYQYLFDIIQRYFRFDVNQGFIPIYESIREKFLKYKPYYEFYTKDYRTNSSYINIGNETYEFISPNEFEILAKQTNISNNEKKIINNTYIGSEFSWHLNNKLRI